MSKDYFPAVLANHALGQSALSSRLGLKIRDDLGMAIIWITHDLGIVAGIADRVNVMYGGLIIEEAPTKILFDNPTHPYTIGLLASLPRTDRERERRLTSIDGIPPVLMENPNYCPFAPRCKFVVDRCRQEHRVVSWREVHQR